MREQTNIGDIAQEQWGVITAEQLHALGISKDQIARLVRMGVLHRLHRGVYAYGLRRVPAKGMLLAAQFACGDGAYITGRTALGLTGVRGLFLGRIEVMVVGRRTTRPAPIQARTTRQQPRAGEIRHDGPLRSATVARALLDMAPTATQRELAGLVTDAIHNSRMDHAAMARVLADHEGRQGVDRLRAAYRDYLPRPSSKSELERAFDRGLAERPWIPDPERNTHIKIGEVNWEIDRYWVDARLAVELQGTPYHSATPDRAKDELKAARLLGIGVQLFTVTDTRFELEPDAVFEDLETILAARMSS